MGELTEEHYGELRPTREAVGVTLGLMLVDQCDEFVAQDLLKKLTEETGPLYHKIALPGCVVNQDLDILIHPRQRRAS